jgi:hypothetical protein
VFATSSVPLPSLLLEQGRTKGKAAIDVVGAQAGKSGGSVLQQALLLASGGGLAGILPVLAGCYFAMAHVCAGGDGARGTGRMGWRANGLLCALRDMSLRFVGWRLSIRKCAGDSSYVSRLVLWSMDAGQLRVGASPCLDAHRSLDHAEGWEDVAW